MPFMEKKVTKYTIVILGGILFFWFIWMQAIGLKSPEDHYGEIIPDNRLQYYSTSPAYSDFQNQHLLSLSSSPDSLASGIYAPSQAVISGFHEASQVGKYDNFVLQMGGLLGIVLIVLLIFYFILKE